MKKVKFLLCFLSLAVMLIVLAGAASASEKINQTVNGSIFIEAEDGALKTYAKVVAKDDASGGKALLLGEPTGNPVPTTVANGKNLTKKAIDYKFNLDRASRLWVYARVRSSDASANRIGVMVNGTYFYGTVEKSDEYSWVRIGVISPSTGSSKDYYILNPGVHTISLLPVTEGVEVDMLLLTRKSGTPKGTDIMDDNLTTGFTFEQMFNEEDIGFSKKIMLNEREYNISDIKPIEGHPRIYFTKEDISEILENATKPENASAWETHLIYVEDRSEKPSLEIMQAQALDYALRGNVEAGKNAVKEALEFYQDNGAAYAKLTGDTYNQLGFAVTTLAMVYDWCYDLLTEEEKLYIIDEMIMIEDQGNNSELRWPPYTENAFTTHMAEATLMHDLMAMSIAIYDERPDIYNFVAGRFFNEFVRYRRWIFQSHTFNQGLNYLNYRVQWEMRATVLIDEGLGIPNVFGEGLQKVFYRMLYMYRPDGFWLPEGDAQGQNWRVMYKTGVGGWIAASYYGDPYLKQTYLETQGGAKFSPRATLSNQQVTTSHWLIINDPDVTPRSERELPLTMYYPSPAGNMTARTGWDYGNESPTVIADLKLDEYSINGHDHRDSGSFMLYYKGYLGRESGTYKIVNNLGYKTDNIGSSEFLSHHHTFFYTRAIAHNCLLVYDPDEEFYGDRNERNRGSANPYEVDKIPNDGGHKQIIGDTNYVIDYESVNNDDHKSAEILGHEYGEDQVEPDFTYLKGDLSYSFSDKVSEYERSYMFLNMKDSDHPAALIVFDRVKSSDPSFKKTWQLYGPNYPEIDGNRVTFEDVRSEQNGLWQYNGRLTLDTLMPSRDNTSYNMVGGEGQWSYVDGNDYPAKMPDSTADYRPEINNWRLELSPKTENELDYFLNVMQVGDADGAEPYDVALIETDSLAGCVLGDRVVVFGKYRDRTAADTVFDFDGEGEYQITVADMKEGTWSVYRNGELIGDFGATVEGGVVTFRGTGGSYRLVYKNNIPKVYAPAPEPEEKSRIMLYVNAVPSYMAEPAYLDGEEIMIPLRSLAEKFGASVRWNADENCAEVVTDSLTVRFGEGDVYAYKTFDGLELAIPLAREVTVRNGVTMVPLSILANILNGELSYTFNDLSHRLDMMYTEATEDTVAKVITDYSSDSDGSTLTYTLSKLAYLKELAIDAAALSEYTVEYSLDGNEWFTAGTLAASEGKNVAIGIGEWCKFVRVTGTGAPENVSFIGNEYIAADYEKIFDVEWSGQNNANETGIQAIDGNINTLWSAQGIPQYLIFDLGFASERAGVEIMWNKGNERQAYFDILGSDDGESWTHIIDNGVSSGVNADYEKYNFDASSAYRYIKVEMYGNSTGDWNAIKEIRFLQK